MNEYKSDEIKRDIIEYKNDSDTKKLQKHYNNKTYSEILSVSRRELSHSSFIAWLLNNQESHNLANYPIMKFFEILYAFSIKEQPLSKDVDELFEAVILGDLIIKKSNILTEKSIDGGFIDIFIVLDVSYLDKDKTVKIIIENKVEASESGEQTQKYYDYFKNEDLENTIYLYVYLKPNSKSNFANLEKESKVECSCKQYLQINYQGLLDYLLLPALEQNISEKTKDIISNYIQSLAYYDINEKDKKGLVMAIEEKEKELLNRFWKNNKTLITAAIYALSDDDEDAKKINEIIEKISRPKISDFFEHVKLKTGDKIKIKNYDKKTAEVIDEKTVSYEGEILSFNQWGMKVLGRSNNIYSNGILINPDGSEKTFQKIREELS